MTVWSRFGQSTASARPHRSNARLELATDSPVAARRAQNAGWGASSSSSIEEQKLLCVADESPPDLHMDTYTTPCIGRGPSWRRPGPEQRRPWRSPRSRCPRSTIPMVGLNKSDYDCIMMFKSCLSKGYPKPISALSLRRPERQLPGRRREGAGGQVRKCVMSK